MITLENILNDVVVQQLVGTKDQPVSGLTLDSREVSDKMLFAAIPGTKVDGHRFIDQSIQGGANVILCEKLPEDKQEGVTYIKVANSAESLGILASNFYGRPSGKLKLVGITGTNGKTTTANLLFQVFRHLEYKTGMLSTIHYRINDRTETATHTTPNSIAINKVLADMVETNCKYCFMEVSSHAIDQNRVSGLQFDGAIFTNLTHEHLDYHETFDQYMQAKKTLFDGLNKDAFALVNADDKHGKVMVQNTKADKYTYGLQTVADFRAKVIENTFAGLKLEVDGEEMHTPLVGTFNAYNLLATYSAANLLEVEKKEALTALSKVKGAEGRFDYFVSKNEVIALVDYAHSPDALKQVLQTINEVRAHKETLLTVIGCGGDRDKEKRPIMARVAVKLSDKVILTSDNPRSEKPEAIIEEMKNGIDPQDEKKVLSIPDRKEAIKTACSLAQPNDIVLVAGKGHEKYQVINGERRSFDDKAILEEMLQPAENHKSLNTSNG